MFSCIVHNLVTTIWGRYRRTKKWTTDSTPTFNIPYFYVLTICFQNTEELLKREANLTDVRSTEETPQTDSEVSSVLSAYKSEGDPEVYEGAYTELKRFVEGALDIYKVIYSE